MNYEMWSAQRELNAALGIEINDLVQEGSLSLLDCIRRYNPDTGNKFLIWAAPAIRNAMVGCIRRWNPIFEAKNLGSFIRLDEAVKDEKKANWNLSLIPERKSGANIYLYCKRNPHGNPYRTAAD